MISLDTEGTGLDLHHGAMPFFVTTCDEDGDQAYWDWLVDPLTRRPEIPTSDVVELEIHLAKADAYVLQNPKYDVKALDRISGIGKAWPWEATYDTLMAGHLLASNKPHDLTSMALMYLGINIEPYEKALEVAVKEARSIARRRHPEWRIAAKDLPEMPSAKEKVWKYDSWLPKRLAMEENYPDDHSWYRVLEEYANTDSAVTLPLFKAQKAELEKRGLWEIYLERLKLLPIVYAMEARGVTLNRDRLEKLRTEYAEEAKRAERVCIHIAGNGLVKLPKSGSSNALKDVLFNHLGLTSPGYSEKTGEPSVNKDVLEHWLVTLPERSKSRRFVKGLRDFRKRNTALSYMEGYERFWIPILNGGEQSRVEANPEWYVLHPSLNPTGTDTLRWSSQNPNEQNISKQEGFNLRYLFGPAPGREWWSLDAKNIELRIPAYEAGETEMVELFEHEDEPPYYGSYHMLIFDTLHPDKFKNHGMECKKVYASTWYQWTKNGDFAVQYGAVEESGTADRAYHVPGAQHRIQQRFSKIARLNRRMIDHAEETGYVETLPDRTVNPNQGYPLLCSRSKWGRILPTVPLNYHVQGTAMWVMMRMMIKVQAYLDELNRPLSSPQYFMVMQVHDELVLDFPYVPNKGNLPKIRKVKAIMQSVGNDLVPPVPLPVGLEYHAETWSEGVTC